MEKKETSFNDDRRSFFTDIIVALLVVFLIFLIIPKKADPNLENNKNEADLVVEQKPIVTAVFEQCGVLIREGLTDKDISDSLRASILDSVDLGYSLSEEQKTTLIATAIKNNRESQQ